MKSMAVSRPMLIAARSNAQEWTVDFEFRANGEERASGNLQLWYVKDGASTVGTASIYTVGKFDGLAIVIDTHSGVVRSETS
jgi:mannose-binding lectin 1